MKKKTHFKNPRRYTKKRLQRMFHRFREGLVTHLYAHHPSLYSFRRRRGNW